MSFEGTNVIEKGPEHIPTKEEVLAVISVFSEKAVLVKELSDEQGMYLLETKEDSEKPGEITQYEYVRKGVYPDGNWSAETVIHVVYYEGEIPVGGHSVSQYNPETGEWDETK